MFRLLALFISSMTFSATAFAQAAGGQGGPSGIVQFVPIIFMFVVFYFFIIRPQVKKQKDHQAFVSKLERGQEVITNSGILGRIEGMTDMYITLEIAPNVRIKVLRGAIASAAKTATTQSNEVKA